MHTTSITNFTPSGGLGPGGGLAANGPWAAALLHGDPCHSAQGSQTAGVGMCLDALTNHLPTNNKQIILTGYVSRAKTRARQSLSTALTQSTKQTWQRKGNKIGPSPSKQVDNWETFWIPRILSPSIQNLENKKLPSTLYILTISWTGSSLALIWPGGSSEKNR